MREKRILGVRIRKCGTHNNWKKHGRMYLGWWQLIVEMSRWVPTREPTYLTTGSSRIGLRKIKFFQKWIEVRDGNGAGRARVSLSHTHPRKKNSSTSPYPNLTGIKLLTHPHPHRVTGIISYPYPYPFSYYFNINFN